MASRSSPAPPALKDAGPIEAKPRPIPAYDTRPPPALKDAGPIEAPVGWTRHVSSVRPPALKDAGPIEAGCRLQTVASSLNASGVEKRSDLFEGQGQESLKCQANCSPPEYARPIGLSSDCVCRVGAVPQPCRSRTPQLRLVDSRFPLA